MRVFDRPTNNDNSASTFSPFPERLTTTPEGGLLYCRHQYSVLRAID